MEEVILIHNLSKIYPRNVVALKEINLSVFNGEILGIIGPNGAGKTTLVRLILGLLTATSGEITLWNSRSQDLSFKLRKQIGFFPTDRGMYEELTGEENIRFWAKALNTEENEIEQKMEMLELWDARKRLVKNYSSGMKQRLAFACAILNDPKLLIMDEPTANLDVYSKNLFLDSIKDVGKEKTTVITSHDLYALEKVCSRIVVLQKGVIIGDGTIEELQNRFTTSKVLINTSSAVEPEVLVMLEKMYKMQLINDKQMLFTLSSERISDLVGFLVMKGVRVENVEKVKLSLEEAFLNLAGSEEK
jgi:ABC-2 type transport system ATP-binding protein